MMYGSCVGCKWHHVETKWNNKETEATSVPSSGVTFSNFVEVEELYEIRYIFGVLHRTLAVYDTISYKWAIVLWNNLWYWYLVRVVPLCFMIKKFCKKELFLFSLLSGCSKWFITFRRSKNRKEEAYWFVVLLLKVTDLSITSAFCSQ
jgi:hypothetical protein